MLGGPKNRRESPNTRVRTYAQELRRETKNPQKSALASKVMNPFTRALAPPFIERRRDFYILKIPSNLGTIPSMNMYMNVFYIP
jgi:hypothetical protein